VPEDILDQVQKDLAQYRATTKSAANDERRGDLLSTTAWKRKRSRTRAKGIPFASVGENVAIAAVLMSMMLLPLLDPRCDGSFGSAAQSTGSIVQHLVLVVGMLGGAIAAAGTTPSRAVQLCGKPVEGAPQRMGFSVHGRRLDHNDELSCPCRVANLCGRSATPDTSWLTEFPCGRGASPPRRIRGHHAANFSTFGARLDAPDFRAAQIAVLMVLLDSELLHFSPFRAGRDDRAHIGLRNRPPPARRLPD